MLIKISADRNLNVKIGGIYSNYVIPDPDFQMILFRRAQYEAAKPKKKKRKRDFGY